ncbi:MAG: hypothetical protein GY940_09410, partial [bacterium]|nr:hypothetical protein [bacterium]
MRRKHLILILLLFSAGLNLSGKYHPEIKWKEIADEKFIVVFPEGYEETGAATFDTAHRIYGELLNMWGSHTRIRGPIRILLTDVYDIANGSATFFPYNQIELYLFNPPPDSNLGSYAEWVRLVLTHELTHIFNFNSGSGFTYFLRKILGSHPAFYPIFYAPSWVLEGMAVYAESRLNRWGRLDTPDFDILLRAIAKAGQLPNWSDFWGQPTSWPGPTSIYLYSSAFFRFLGDTYGPDKLSEFMRFFTRYPLPIRFKKHLNPVPLTIHNRFRQAFGKNISALWDEFVHHLEDAAAESVPPSPSSQPPEVKPLTSTGIFHKYPIAVDGRRVLYIEENYKTFPGIYRLNIKTGLRERLVKKSGINGWSYSKHENKLYFSAVDYFKSFYRYSDIFTLDLATGKMKRLTRGRRLSYPVKQTQGKERSTGEAHGNIYCIKRVKDKSFLCLLDEETGSEKILSRGFDSLAFLSISPGGGAIAVSLKQRNQNWRIALFDLEGNLVRILTGGESRSFYPQWKSPDELFFIHQYKKSYRPASLNLRENILHIYGGRRFPALRSFSWLPDGNSDGNNDSNKGDLIVGAFLDAGGYNLGIADISQLGRVSMPAGTAGTGPNPGTGTKEAAPLPESTGGTGKTKTIKRYNFLRDLFPKYIDLNYRDGGNESQPGLLLTGHDLTSQQAFTLEGFYGFESQRAGFRVNYTYDGFYPTLGFSWSDLSDYFTGPGGHNYIHNEKKFRLTGLYPLSIADRRQAYLYGDVHWETITDQPVGSTDRQRYRLNGIKLAFFFNSARRYYDSIS